MVSQQIRLVLGWRRSSGDGEATMEFLVDMVTIVPDGTTEEAMAAMRSREAARSQELADQGSLLRLWRPPLQPGEWRTWGLFRADNPERLEKILTSMPLRAWRTDTVTPLSMHPNDPALRR
jgi:muconolactone D-isomerase